MEERFSIVERAYAQSAGNLNISDPLRGGGVTGLAVGVATAMEYFAVSILAFVVFYGGWLMLTSAGDEKRIASGKKTMLYAAIGLGIVLLGKVLLETILAVPGVGQ